MVSFRKPILVEIIAQFRYQPGILNQSRVLQVATAVVDRGFGEIEMDVHAEQVAGVGPTVSPAVKLWWPDRQRLVQIREGTCIMNLVGSYPGWEVFLDLVNRTRSGLVAAGVTSPPEQLSLTTIDRFTVPAANFRLGDYVNADGTRIPRFLADAAEPCDVSLGRGVVQSGGRNRAITLAVRLLPEANVQITLESRFANRLVDQETVDSLLEQLHGESNASFMELVTLKTINDVMGGPK